MPTDHDARDAPSPPPSGGSAIYFDGTSDRRRAVTLRLADRLEISEGETTLGGWASADTRRADSPPSTLRLSCVTAPALARLEVRDSAVVAELVARCGWMDENAPGRGVAAIVGWSLAATASIIAVVLFGVPLAADRLTPLVPDVFERRLGDVADGQVKALFGGKGCDNAAGQQAFAKLVTALREPAGLYTSLKSRV